MPSLLYILHASHLFSHHRRLRAARWLSLSRKVFKRVRHQTAPPDPSPLVLAAEYPSQAVVPHPI